MSRSIAVLRPAALAILAGVALASAHGQERDSRKSESPQDYLDGSGRLKYPLRLECQAAGDAKASGAWASLGARVVVTITREGRWTSTAYAGAGVSGRGAAAIGAKKTGSLGKGGLEEVAAILHENDLAGLRSYTYSRRQRHAVAAAVGYKVTVVFGHRRYSCLLTKFVRTRTRSLPLGAVDRPGAELPRKEVPDRFHDICLGLLEIAGQR